MATETVNISLRKYAHSLRVSDKTVRNAIASGAITKGVSYRMQKVKGVDVPVPEINVEVANQEWGHIHMVNKIRPGQKKDKIIEKVDAPFFLQPENKSTQHPPVSDATDIEDEELEDVDVVTKLKITTGMAYGEATRRNEIIELAINKNKYLEQQRVLINKSEVEKALFEAGTELKKQLLNISSRVIPNIRAAENDVEAIKILDIELMQILNEFSQQEIIK